MVRVPQAQLEPNRVYHGGNGSSAPCRRPVCGVKSAGTLAQRDPTVSDSEPARAPGTFPVPGGVCAGLELGLDQPSILSALLVDEDGEVRFDIIAPAPICDLYVQAIDLAACEASNVTTVSGN